MLKAFCKRRKGTLVLLGIALAVLAFAWIKIQAVRARSSMSMPHPSPWRRRKAHRRPTEVCVRRA